MGQGGTLVILPRLRSSSTTHNRISVRVIVSVVQCVAKEGRGRVTKHCRACPNDLTTEFVLGT
jgi:hypothetical protein